MDAVTFRKALIRLEVKETALTLAVSVMLPFLIHLIPPVAGTPVGAMLLPMFYAPFIAIVLFRPQVAIITGLFSPLLNSLLTGHPLPEKVAFLTAELVVFSIVAYLMHRRWRHFLGIAPIAYLATVLIVARKFLFSILVYSLPGVIMLFLINVLLIRYQPQSNDRDKFLNNL